MNDKVSTLDIVTLIVAISGLALAALSLGWQAATFVLTGSRVALRLRRGALKREFGGTTRMAGPLQPTERDIALMRDQGFGIDVIIVEVRNSGRLAVSVEDVTAVTDDGWGFARMADPENPALPHRLEPGAKASWHVELAPLQLLVDNDRKSRSVRMRVELGTGKIKVTKQHMTLATSA